MQSLYQKWFTTVGGNDKFFYKVSDPFAGVEILKMTAAFVRTMSVVSLALRSRRSLVVRCSSLIASHFLISEFLCLL